jgi:hypothetical protein
MYVTQGGKIIKIAVIDKTTVIYTYLTIKGSGVVSPLDSGNRVIKQHNAVESSVRQLPCTTKLTGKLRNAP